IRVLAGNNHYLIAEGNSNETKSGNSKVVIKENASLTSGSIYIDSTGVKSDDQSYLDSDLKLVTIYGTQSPIQLLGSLNTIGDRSVVAKYQGKTIVPNGAVQIKADDVDIFGKIDAAGQVLIESRKDIDINDLTYSKVRVTDNTGKEVYKIDSHYLRYDDSTIKGEYVELVSLNDLNNYGTITAEIINISAGQFLNEGVVWAESDLYLKGESNIVNQFGGVIYANNASLESTGTIINGSLRPYRIETKVLPLYQARAGTITYTTGTFDKLPEDPEGSYQVPVESYSAKILTNNLEIVSGSLKNINPYFIVHTESVNTTPSYLDDELSEQVFISADQNLTLVVSNELINSSAIIEANSGKLVVDAGNIKNERYRIQVNQAPGTFTEDDLCIGIVNCTVEAAEEQFVYFTSPAGKILSGRDAIFKSSGTLLNDLSFIEIWGDLHVEIPEVIQYGFKLQASVVVIETTNHSRSVCEAKVLGKCLSSYTKHWSVSTPDLNQLETGQLPALLSVEGYLFGEGAGNFEVTTLQVDYQ
ncbi:MAG: hypothetical protein RPR97_08995, partial [Colwellia sp.]